MLMQKAESLVKKIEQQAKEESLNVSIAIVDAGAHLCFFKRMPGAALGTVEVAQSKARTAALFPLPTGDFGELVSNQSLDGMLNTNGGMVGFSGGIPINVDGEVIGAIGVSGATKEQDLALAEQGFSAL